MTPAQVTRANELLTHLSLLERVMAYLGKTKSDYYHLAAGRNSREREQEEKVCVIDREVMQIIVSGSIEADKKELRRLGVVLPQDDAFIDRRCPEGTP